MTTETVPCWILTEKGLKGTENQCIALAEAAGLRYELKHIRLRNPWKFFTPRIRHFSHAALTDDSSELTAPWPKIVIASGRKSIAPALWIKKQSGGQTKIVVIQSPVIKDKQFDLVIVPRHDNYHAPNAMQITGALSVINSAGLAVAKKEWSDVLGSLATPRIAVLIGGTSRTHQITDAVADHLIAQLQGLLDSGYSLMVTASRRTPIHIQDKIRGALIGEVHFYDGQGPNPYQGYLAWADAFLVTEDSVSMASEAISTGKPVYIIKMEGGSKRFQRFHDHLIDSGYARWFAGNIDDFSYTNPNDLSTAAEKLKLYSKIS